MFDWPNIRGVFKAKIHAKVIARGKILSIRNNAKNVQFFNDRPALNRLIQICGLISFDLLFAKGIFEKHTTIKYVILTE